MLACRKGNTGEILHSSSAGSRTSTNTSKTWFPTSFLFSHCVGFILHRLVAESAPYDQWLLETCSQGTTGAPEAMSNCINTRKALLPGPLLTSIGQNKSRGQAQPKDREVRSTHTRRPCKIIWHPQINEKLLYILFVFF